MPCLSRKLPSNKYCLFVMVATAWTLCTSFAAPLVQAAPAGTVAPKAAAKVSSAGPSTSTRDDKLALWAKIKRNIDRKKLERLRICVQAQGAQADVFQAINICAPCISSETVAAASLTAQERQCLNRQPGSNDSSSKGSPIPGHNPLPSRANPQCSGTKTGRGPKGDAALDRAYARVVAASEAVRNAEDRLQEHEVTTSMGEDAWRNRLDELENALDRTRAELRRAEAALREEQRAHDDSWFRIVFDWVALQFSSDGTNDPSVETPGDLREPGKDPRCAGKKIAAGWGAPWQDMCRGDDGHIDPMKCARRLTTIIGAVTNGRCWAEPGKDDAPTVVCKDENGQPVATGVDPSGQPTTPGATSVNDPTPWNRPKPGKGTAGPFIPESPIGTFIEELCANGRCPDPPPVHGKITTAPNGSMRDSRSAPPADQECLNGVNSTKSACRVSREPSNLPSVDVTNLKQRWKKKRWNKKSVIRARRQFDEPGITKRLLRKHRFMNRHIIQRHGLKFQRSRFSSGRYVKTFRSRRPAFTHHTNFRPSFGR